MIMSGADPRLKTLETEQRTADFINKHKAVLYKITIRTCSCFATVTGPKLYLMMEVRNNKNDVPYLTSSIRLLVLKEVELVIYWKQNGLPKVEAIHLTSR